MKWYHFIPLALLGLLVLAVGAQASHLRGGTFWWEEDPENPNEVVFHGLLFERADWNSQGVGQERATGGYQLTVAGNEAPAPLAIPFQWQVKWISGPSLNWKMYEMVDLDTGNPGASYTLPPGGDIQSWTASWSESARLGAGDGHVNNGGKEFQMMMHFNTGPTGAVSPQSFMLPIKQCLIDSICSFEIPASSDDRIVYRWATSEEAVGATGGTFNQPPSATIDAATGVYTINTNGIARGSPFTYYSTQVMIESWDDSGSEPELVGAVPVDFFIQVVDELQPPVWIDPTVCGATLRIPEGELATIVAKAQSYEPGVSLVTVDTLSPVAGATYTSFPGNPGTMTADWTVVAGVTNFEFIAYSDSGATAEPCMISVDAIVNDPPVADFTFEDREYTVGESVGLTDLSDDLDYEPAISGGPGISERGIKEKYWIINGVEQAYPVSEMSLDLQLPALGNYAVAIRVVDSWGAEDTSDTKFVRVTNTPPTASFDAPSGIHGGDSADFTDTSNDPEDNIVSWFWTLGNGETSTAKNPTSTYGNPGEYFVCLTVEDAKGFDDRTCKSLRVLNRPPEVSIVVHPGSPEGSTAVNYEFRCIATDVDGAVAGCTWDFGDGAEADGTIVQHRYSIASNEPYRVRVVAIDEGGAKGFDEVDVLIHNQAPYARFSHQRGVGDAVDTIRFTSESFDKEDGMVPASWDFGDGTTDLGDEVTHAFPDPETTYTVRLAVTDSEGATTTLIAFVTPADLAVIADSDGDGVADTKDNCPDAPNPSQGDFDRDGIGDSCDVDTDGDGTPDSRDDDPRSGDTETVPGHQKADEPDSDGDGLTDKEEAILGTNPAGVDSDLDGLTDAEELILRSNPNDDMSPSWVAEDVKITREAGAIVVTWTSPTDNRIKEFRILSDGQVLETITYNGSTGYMARLPEIAELTVETILHNPVATQPEQTTHSVPPAPEPAPKSKPVWPWVAAGSGLFIVGLGVAGYAMLRRD